MKIKFQGVWRTCRKIKTAKSRTSKNYCSICGYHIRGNNHDNGDHHLSALRNVKK